MGQEHPFVRGTQYERPDEQCQSLQGINKKTEGHISDSRGVRYSLILSN